MERYLIKKPTQVQAPANVNTTTDSSLSSTGNAAVAKPVQRYNSSVPQMVDLNKLSRDPAKRKRMADYHPNQRDEIRRKYLTWGPHQPRGFNFPYKLIGKRKKKRRFNPDWFDQYGNWLEYSEKEEIQSGLVCCRIMCCATIGYLNEFFMRKYSMCSIY
jgi:hypothetical protein